LTNQQTAVGWDQFVRGKWSKLWVQYQYEYARRFQLTNASKNWQVNFIRALANASFRLWEIRNGCRHGIDIATKSQALSEQTQREVRCLYELRERVLPQDRPIFHDSVEHHLQETQAQQRTWITHNKKLIVHSARVAAHQARLCTRQLKRFFPLWKVQSRISNSKPTEMRRFNITRLATHFATRLVSRSIVKCKAKDKVRRFNTPTLSSFYDPNSTSISLLPTIDEKTASKTTSPQRRQTQRRKFNRSLFTDHPGLNGHFGIWHYSVMSNFFYFLF
jgi:hypothetical protein